MRVGNRMQVCVRSIGTLNLHLPSGFMLEMSNCYYVPTLSKNIISGSRLLRDGYSFNSKNNGWLIYYKDAFYGSAPLVDGLFVLNLGRIEDTLHIDAKRLKLVKDDTYTWHCRLGHIGKGRMKQLFSDGLLQSFDEDSFDQCEA